MPENAADRLLKAIHEKENHSCVGLDPRIGQIPEHIKKRARREHGNTKEAVASAIVDFNTLLIDAIHDIVPVVKPQMAFYEGYGPAGVAAFQRTVNYAKRQGLVVIEDAKRNDIGSTAKAYAEGHLGEVDLISNEEKSFDVDFITVTPYLGSDGIAPFLEKAAIFDKGAFILCRTSNKSAGDLQDRMVLLTDDENEFLEKKLAGSSLSLKDLPQYKDGYKEGTAPNYVLMGNLIDKWSNIPDLMGETDYSSIGAVVGATYPEEAKLLRQIMHKTIFLVPGYGAQGGSGEDIPNFLNEDGYGAIVNSSRGIIFAYQKDQYKNDYPPTKFADAARQAAIDMKIDINKYLEAAKKIPW